ncbi:hypothetical protein E2C01_015126 [Portunus trituberculatus]|uniref:Uncharacterized protein n=1 Tax=Portunus trituberculatus TaxID=210409 RepID=A0A5B7DM02_PORTR|nr:hypothetical protein [Portunus trituberculatus]
MSFAGDMGTTTNKIACAINGRKLNSASYTFFNTTQGEWEPLSAWVISTQVVGESQITQSHTRQARLQQ